MIKGCTVSKGEDLMKRIQDPLGWPELKSFWEEEEAGRKNRISRRNLSLTPYGQVHEAFKAFNKAIKISPNYCCDHDFQISSYYHFA
jgi:hypothetical protein